MRPNADRWGCGRCTSITDAEIFGWSRPQPRRRGRPKAITPEQFFADLQPGDYVVHIDHGIGVFQGLIKLTLEGIENEYLQVAYASGDKLYVPIHQADRLSKYIGADDHAPDVHRLGTADWSQVRSKAKEAALEVARELLELYAVRELVAGLRFQRRYSRGRMNWKRRSRTRDRRSTARHPRCEEPTCRSRSRWIA